MTEMPRAQGARGIFLTLWGRAALAVTAPQCSDANCNGEGSADGTAIRVSALLYVSWCHDGAQL